MGKVRKGTGPNRRGNPRKIVVKNHPSRYNAVNAALQKKSRKNKGAHFHKMTDNRAAKVKDYVRAHPLKFPSRTPPEAWCRKLISELRQKNWKITVKDIHIWHRHLPHLFTNPREVSPTPLSSSSESESDTSNDGINDADITAPDTAHEDAAIIDPGPDIDIDDDVDDDCCCSIV